MTPAPRRRRALSILALACASCLSASGCNQFGPRQRMEESRRYIQALRSENDQLKDQVLTFRNQNEDLTERAADDVRRLAVQSRTIEDLTRSVHAYQAENKQSRDAFRELRDSLPAAVRSAMADGGSRLALGSDRDIAPSETTPPEPQPVTRSERRKPVEPIRIGAEPARGDGWSPATVPLDEPGLDPAP